MTFGIDLIDLIKAVGLIGLALIIFAESGLLIGFLFPGDSLLVTAGLLASQGWFNVHLLAFVLFLAAIAGDSVGYAFGRKVGPRLFKKQDSLLFQKENLQRAEEFYERHGGKTIILARFMPVIRTFAPIVAGVGRMKYRRFVSYNVVGGLIWAVGLTYLGYFIGSKVDNVDHYILPFVAIIVLTSILPPAIHILRNQKSRTMFWRSLKNLKNKKIF